MLNDQLQELTTDTCGIIQLYFYKNLFDIVRDSKIIDDEFLTKKTVTTILNEIFSTNKEKNKKKWSYLSETMIYKVICIIVSVNQQSSFIENCWLLTGVNLLHVNQSCMFFYGEKLSFKKIWIFYHAEVVLDKSSTIQK